ncbi:hypothetical protein Tco_0440869, partial [Tanacetum coccineum]
RCQNSLANENNTRRKKISISEIGGKKGRSSKSENNKLRSAHKLRYPDAKMISLRLGDIAQPIPKVISSSMAKV